MNKSLHAVLWIGATLVAPVMAATPITDEASLQQALVQAAVDPTAGHLVFAKDATITLSAPAVYNGSNPLEIEGNGATIDGSHAGSFTLSEDLTAMTEDGTLVFNTAADIKINHLTISHSATRGLVVNIPENATGEDISVHLNRVEISHSALFGLHIDDNMDEFDDGNSGSAIGVELLINNSIFFRNGTGAIDFDGVRVDERGEGSIRSHIINTWINENGGDGIELDEGGTGAVDATMIHVTLNDNGFYNEEDLDDGFDIDEAGEGDLKVTLIDVTVNNNLDEGLDFDEAGEGNLLLEARNISAANNADEAIKLDEEDDGDIIAKVHKTTVTGSGDDGIQYTEIGAGKISASFNRTTATNNNKYGIKLGQWIEEDEEQSMEPAGSATVKHTLLSGNGKGNDIDVDNVIIK
ncbi:hypothetical protein [Pseudomaricurvus sp. HS19]|uniref:hypothetical protein n=1 Tax=Pseudomaricurvus sp. HS19 TaxID=2692626 RepID=UPI00136E3DAA|nr:hypothetical protein [Pseudomaricurvus sp. HS19]MYM64279.1 hypothetical protein [Pseudomaricurvus sp. HS19]